MRNYLREMHREGCTSTLPDTLELLKSSAKDVVRFRVPDWDIPPGESWPNLIPGTPIHLPFSKICLEFDFVHNGGHKCPALIYAEERNGVALAVLLFGPNMQMSTSDWRAMTSAVINTAAGIQVIGGGRKLMYEPHPESDLTSEGQYVAQAMLLYTLLDFLQCLSCTNVRMTERHPPGSKFVFGQACQEDAYYELTIDPNPKNYDGQAQGGTHASPREHLRRGHIRHLANGKSVWINAMVVNPGVGGKIEKDYKIKAVH